MRNRKLYLSELLKRSLDKKLCVHLKNTKGNMSLWYDDILTCLQEIRYSYLWNLQVNIWTIDKCQYEKHKRFNILIIEVIEVE